MFLLGPILVFLLLVAPGIRLLLLAHRTREAPEFWGGLYFVGAAIAQRQAQAQDRDLRHLDPHARRHCGRHLEPQHRIIGPRSDNDCCRHAPAADVGKIQPDAAAAGAVANVDPHGTAVGAAQIKDLLRLLRSR